MKSFEDYFIQNIISIEHLLKEHRGEYNTFEFICKTYNETFSRLHDLEKAINDIEKILNRPQFEEDNIPCNCEEDIEELKNILKKVKSERI